MWYRAGEVFTVFTSPSEGPDRSCTDIVGLGHVRGSTHMKRRRPLIDAAEPMRMICLLLAMIVAPAQSAENVTASVAAFTAQYARVSWQSTSWCLAQGYSTAEAISEGCNDEYNACTGIHFQFRDAAGALITPAAITVAGATGWNQPASQLLFGGCGLSGNVCRGGLEPLTSARSTLLCDLHVSPPALHTVVGGAGGDDGLWQPHHRCLLRHRLRPDIRNRAQR